MKNMYKYFCFILSITILIGCSSKTDNVDSAQIDSSSTTVTEIFSENALPKLLTVEDTIQYNLSEAMERLLYRDNSGLYENEFQYLQDEYTFDEYLEFGEISYQAPGQVIELVVDSLFLFDHDSAAAWATVTLEFQDGKLEKMTEQLLIVYYKDGRWIKPTVGVIKNQMEYEEIIRQAEEAAKWEE